ncbi:MAG: nucleotidyltransferase [Phycisphaerae bacterium]|nr:nucleotidyltransferase [Phycisphaerae bacterium]
MAFQPTLLILAAGMGSRYGGLKQIDPVGPHGELIIDYSLWDALRAGFRKIVFVIRRSFEQAFREAVESKIGSRAETAYVCQELDCCLGGFELPAGRQKPWGTGHAILTAQEMIHEPFAVINADDYYGPAAYRIMAEQLQTIQTRPHEYAMVGYILRKTLSACGAVARGICRHDSDMYLTAIAECTGIRPQGRQAVYADAQGHEHMLSGDEIVSMNLWGFAPDIFAFLQQQFSAFLSRCGRDNKSEFYIPAAVNALVQSGQKKVKILTTPDSWFGVTYRGDKEMAQACIRELISRQVYPDHLWEHSVQQPHTLSGETK